MERTARLSSRLILVTHSLPIITKKDSSVSTSSGGLMACLKAFAKTDDFRWFGWPGQLDASAAEELVLSVDPEQSFKLHPVFLEASLSDSFFGGFANSVLWPLFHDHMSLMAFEESGWEAYRETNRLFANTISRNIRQGDLVWIHDYHLLLLPQMLRSDKESSHQAAAVGIFLHVPFPPHRVFGALPVREEVLRGMLHCDVIGFHTDEDVENFLQACSRYLGLSTGPGRVEFEGRLVAVECFSVGIDVEGFVQRLRRPKVQERIAELQSMFDSRRLMIGVDRLDICKGIPHKLRALERFFTDFPEWIGQTTFIQIAVPTREAMEQTRVLKADIDELVGRINSKIGRIGWMPIHLIYNPVDPDELTALFAASDVCVVSSLRDGLNLVSFEYVCTQQDNRGVLLLSEFTGAARRLDGGVLINPWDPHGLARAIQSALTMSRCERDARQSKVFEQVSAHTSTAWGRAFVAALNEHGNTKVLDK